MEIESDIMKRKREEINKLKKKRKKLPKQSFESWIFKNNAYKKAEECLERVKQLSKIIENQPAKQQQKTAVKILEELHILSWLTKKKRIKKVRNLSIFQEKTVEILLADLGDRIKNNCATYFDLKDSTALFFQKMRGKPERINHIETWVSQANDIVEIAELILAKVIGTCYGESIKLYLKSFKSDLADLQEYIRQSNQENLQPLSILKTS